MNSNECFFALATLSDSEFYGFLCKVEKTSGAEEVKYYKKLRGMEKNVSYHGLEKQVQEKWDDYRKGFFEAGTEGQKWFSILKEVLEKADLLKIDWFFEQDYEASELLYDADKTLKPSLLGEVPECTAPVNSPTNKEHAMECDQ